MGQLRLVIHKMVGFSPDEEEYYRRVAEKTVQAMNSREFKKAILNSGYPSGWFRKTWKSGMYGLNESLESFYKKVISGKEETETGESDGEVDILIRLIKMPSGVLGSMNPGNPWYNLSEAFFNECFNNRFDHQLAGNLAHEFIHHLGYYHKTKIAAIRAHDPAYTVGYVIRDIYPQDKITSFLKSTLNSRSDMDSMYMRFQGACSKCG